MGEEGLHGGALDDEAVVGQGFQFSGVREGAARVGPVVADPLFGLSEDADQVLQLEDIGAGFGDDLGELVRVVGKGSPAGVPSVMGGIVAVRRRRGCWRVNSRLANYAIAAQLAGNDALA